MLEIQEINREKWKPNIIKECEHMENMRLGSDVLEKQERARIKKRERITNQPSVLPPIMNYPVILSNTS